MDHMDPLALLWKQTSTPPPRSSVCDTISASNTHTTLRAVVSPWPSPNYLSTNCTLTFGSCNCRLLIFSPQWNQWDFSWGPLEKRRTRHFESKVKAIYGTLPCCDVVSSVFQSVSASERLSQYPEDLINTTLSEVNFKDRKLALQQIPKTNLRILRFVTQYQPSEPNLKQILMKNWHLIEKQPLLSEIYKKPPLVSYKRGRSLKDTLVGAKLWKGYVKHALGSRV